MCFCGMSRACPEFSFTEEDIKKFVSKLKITTKRLFVYASRDSIYRKREVTFEGQMTS